jgi:hypothetical protein
MTPREENLYLLHWECDRPSKYHQFLMAIVKLPKVRGKPIFDF